MMSSCQFRRTQPLAAVIFVGIGGAATAHRSRDVVTRHANSPQDFRLSNHIPIGHRSASHVWRSRDFQIKGPTARYAMGLLVAGALDRVLTASAECRKASTVRHGSAGTST